MKRRFCADDLREISISGHDVLKAKDGVVEVDDQKVHPAVIEKLETLAADDANPLYEGEPESKRKEK